MNSISHNTLPINNVPYQDVGQKSIKCLKQAENLLVAIDLITHPWDHIFLRNSMRHLASEVFETSFTITEYYRNIQKTINDIHGGVAVQISFNPLKYSTGVDQMSQSLLATTHSLLAVVTVAHQLKFLSGMNMNILNRELQNLMSFIKDFSEAIKTMSLTHMEYLQSVQVNLENAAEKTKGHLQVLQNNEMSQPQKYEVSGIADIFNTHQNMETGSFTKSTYPGVMMDTVIGNTYEKEIKNTTAPKKTSDTHPAGVVSSNYLDTTQKLNDNGPDRKKQIVGMIQSRGVISINDIADFFPAVSRKTIQRDLSELIDQGKITRTGDKRWATYRI